MSRETLDPLRAQLVRFLDWHEARVDFDQAVDGIPPASHGVVPERLPHSPWQILEHLRRAQADILDFCVSSDYKEKAWPDDYWPAPAPGGDRDWDESVTGYRRDLKAFKELVQRQPDLLAAVPNATRPDQTCLRAVLLAADHAAYHIGQLVLVRRLLGIWPT
ncbi:MAG: DinB family protein [Acidimicrobiia bacterium]|nr:DinB family protein [Acidimicrobiia bacterium]